MPLFTIGVTAYNRPDWLRQNLSCLLRQTFSDFEILIGNDYGTVPLSPDSLGINDPRIRFFNHLPSLGQSANMNFLLRESRGKYFTWIADDDFHSHSFLNTIHQGICLHHYPPCLFTSYEIVPAFQQEFPEKSHTGLWTEYNGANFLNAYFRRECRVIGPYGMFDRDTLLKLGGFESLSAAPIALYGEYLLLVKTASLSKILYWNAPLVYYRFHPQVGALRMSFDHHQEASENFIRESLKIISNKNLSQFFSYFLSSLLDLCIAGFRSRMQSTGKVLNLHACLQFLSIMKASLDDLPAGQQKSAASACIKLKTIQLLISWLRQLTAALMPTAIVKAIRVCRSRWFRKSPPPFWN